MDMTRHAIQILNMLPYSPLLAKATNKLSGCMKEGPVQTRYGYWIAYKDTGKYATAIRKLVISGSYERPYFNMLRRLINFGDTVIDVGAHKGYVSLLMQKLAGGGRIFAIEPNPENLVSLHRNIDLNLAANIKVIEKAVSDQKRRMNLYCSPNIGANASLIPYSYFPEDKIEVEVDTLDDMFGDLERLNFIKVDTEGSELQVLLGGRQIISRHKPIICFEVSLTFWAYLEQSVDKLFNYLRDLDYKLFVLKNAQLYPYRWLDERIINMFAVHISRMQELTKLGIISSGDQ